MSKGQVIKIGGHKVSLKNLDSGLLDKINNALGADCAVECSTCSIGSAVGRAGSVKRSTGRIGRAMVTGRSTGCAMERVGIVVSVRNIKKYGVGRKGCMGEWKSKK